MLSKNITESGIIHTGQGKLNRTFSSVLGNIRSSIPRQRKESSQPFRGHGN